MLRDMISSTNKFSQEFKEKVKNSFQNMYKSNGYNDHYSSLCSAMDTLNFLIDKKKGVFNEKKL